MRPRSRARTHRRTHAHPPTHSLTRTLQVVDLLVEQMECADFIVLNKKDKCSDEQMETLAGVFVFVCVCVSERERKRERERERERERAPVSESG